ncbi:MAG: transaldolase [Desulfomonilia bacterium]|nr:transaldolase [Desulfomonilia bacterium]
MTKLHELAKLGQAAWFDYIRRSLITSGELTSLIDQGIRGVTSNPTIFEKAITGSIDYDEDLKNLVAAGKTIGEIYESLVLWDIAHTADLFRDLYESTDGLDGYVSIEVSPTLAYDTEKTIQEARRLFRILDRPNVMIKVPATKQGVPAIEALIAEGINVNVTLLFSVKRYEEAAWAYISGLEKYLHTGKDLSSIASVASFFVSRVDTSVDSALESIGNTALQGKIAIANAKIAYELFSRIFSSTRWKTLTQRGARVQRLLWASTGTKNPTYSDTRYVDELIGPHTVNTVPPATLQAFLDHGAAQSTLANELNSAHDQVNRVEALGIDLDAITDNLEREGVTLFAASFESLMKSIRNKRRELISK